ncbi:Metallo-dependent phosphatase [Anaeromyces robustus]|uniref:Metallo-dependent phosphatase n=1 Tax=Anaeromyces robustus TaxID=1754192 RepID=A0A1Y1WU31_9FUNG|nr:Metallo-dependent phosphatase [Anaeromyces robustus]|eukprot:ORX76915.1 Metallo-dependent phosphatase [Anaeromyces robustus]
MKTSEIITSKEENFKKLKLKESGKDLKKFGKGNSKVKICCISDTHEKHDNICIPDDIDIDILIYAGDFTNWHSSNKKSVHLFLDWFKKQNAKYKFLVCGNHDIYFYFLRKSKKEALKEEMKKNNILYLENNFGNFSDLNLNIYGFPYTLKRNIFYMADAFEIKKSKMNKICNQVFDKNNNNIDILITHSPPYNILDKTYKNKNIGSLTLLEDLILRVKPKIHIFGHNHDEPGYKIFEYNEEEILFINASKVHGKTPIIFDYYYDK